MMPLTQKITLEKLLPAIVLGDAAQVDVSGLQLDSRKIQAGDIFVALVGANIDGRQFIAKAIELGAAAIFVAIER